MATTRKIIEIDEALCNGCGNCVPACHEGAIQIIDGKARLVADRYCDGLGACLGDCPTGALRVVEREADAFDEAAVQVHLESQRSSNPPVDATSPSRSPNLRTGGGCPGAQLHSRKPAPMPASDDASGVSALSHWPVQIHLVPPHAPFLEGADLLVAADCVPVAYARFHQDFLANKKVMLGCPKFDDVQSYVQKFIAIFETARINSITVVAMQVPCCQGLPAIVEKALAISGVDIPAETVIISLEGEVLARRALGN